VLFLGEYEHTIDAKRRLAIPAEVRDVFNPQEHGSAFVAAPGPGDTLWLWPERTFEQQARDLQRSLLGDEDLDEFERLLFSQSARIPLDAAGRVRLPERLVNQYGLSGVVMVLGVRDHLELMSPEKWRAKQAELAPMREQIRKRARKAMLARRQERDQ